jgi:hypothetical protein
MTENKKQKEKLLNLIDKFDFSVLFKDEEKSSLIQFLPIINLIIEIIILFLILKK